MSLFGSPAPPPQIIQQAPVTPLPSANLPTENPTVTAQRVQAQAQADSAVTSNIQDVLRSKMAQQAQTFGISPIQSTRYQG